MSEYNASSIRMEKDAEAHRRNPSRYLGSGDLIGIKNQLFEIVDNAADEMIRYARENSMSDYAKIYIEIRDDDSVVVEDFGNGIPCEIHPEYGDYTVYLLCESDSSGGKGRGTAGYEGADPSGVNGAGMAVAKSLSTYFELYINSLSANGRYYLRYDQGKRSKEGLIRLGDLETDKNGNKITGTKIIYKFDPTIFDYKTRLGVPRSVVYDNSEIQERLKGMILGTPKDNLEIIYKYKDNDVIHFSNKNTNIFNYINRENSLYIPLENSPEDFKGHLFIEYDKYQGSSTVTTIVNRMIMKESTTDAAIEDSIWEEMRYQYNKDVRKDKNLKGYTLYKKNFIPKVNIFFILTLPAARYSSQTKDRLTTTGFLPKLTNQIFNKIRNNERFKELFYEPFILEEIENWSWAQKRKREEERRAKEEEKKKKNAQAEKELDIIKNDPLKYELNKDNSDIVVKESPKPISESTLVYVEGKSAGTDFNNLHKEKEYPIAIAIAEGKVPNMADPDNETNPMTIDNRAYCLEAGYKDIAIFTDADADGNHIKILHLYQIYKFAKHYLDNRKVYIIPAPYSSISISEYITINLYDEIKSYAPGTVYTFNAKEHQALIKAGGRTRKKFRGLADSSISLKDLLTNRSNWIQIEPPTPKDIEYMEKLLQPGSDFKSDFMVNVYTDRLYFSTNIDDEKNYISVEREDLINAFETKKISNTPEDANYKSFLSRSGLYDENEIKNNIEKEFEETHDFGY